MILLAQSLMTFVCAPMPFVVGILAMHLPELRKLQVCIHTPHKAHAYICTHARTHTHKAHTYTPARKAHVYTRIRSHTQSKQYASA